MADQAQNFPAPEVSPQMLTLIQAIVEEAMAAAPPPKRTKVPPPPPKSDPSDGSEDTDDYVHSEKHCKRP